MKREEVHKLIDLAREKADRKWGVERSIAYGDKGDYTVLAILMEEVGEVANAILEHDYDNQTYEIFDCLQVLTAWAESRKFPGYGIMD